MRATNPLKLNNVLKAVSAATLLLCSAQAAAQAWPSRPIRMITFNGPGGGADLLYRLMGEGITQALGQPVLNEIRPGAGGVISTDAIAKSPPDGYTIGMGAGAPLCIQPLLKNATYDALKSFEHITLVFDVPLFLVVSSAVPATSVKELIAYLKANPGKLNFGSNGVGTAMHLAGEQFKLKTGTDIVHVPFKSDTEVTTNMAGGTTQVGITGATTLLPLAKEGKVKFLAALTTERDPDMPDVPSAREAGLGDFVVSGWGSVLAPAGTSSEIVQRLNKAMVSYMARPEIAAKAQATRLKPKNNTPEQMTAWVRRQCADYGAAFEQAKIKVEK
jgi:tripartite-type tricarboxylate transporter receptor subunit TctC